MHATLRSVSALIVLLGVPVALAAQSADTIRWEPYTLDVGDTAHTFEMGRLTVPEVRGSPEAGTVELAFVRLPSRAEAPGPPIVYLDGGPGGSGVGIARSPAYYRLFDGLRDVADVILLSQRGTGLSSPGLVCPLRSGLPDDLFTTRERMLEALLPEVEACARSWRERGAELEGYTTVESADDLESLRRALGVEQLSLLGFSYGTHLGLAAMRRHGDRIARAVLIGTEGPEHTWKLPSTPDLQLRHVSWLAARDEDAAAGTPDLYAAVDTLLRRLDGRPVSLVIDARGGERTITLGGDGMRYLLQRDMGDTNDLPVWPAAIRLTLDGDHRMLAALAGRRFREIAGVPLMGILMDCASGARDERLSRIREEAPRHVTGSMTNLWFPEVCEAVPEVRAGDGFRSHFVSDVPTLFLSGTLDANTPPYQAHYVSWGWPRATHLVVEKAGHESVMPYGPAQEVIIDFFRGEDVSGRTIPARELDFRSVEEVREMTGG
jgi:pimeloyl-ACP methyl ester carboxylesterase